MTSSRQHPSEWLPGYIDEDFGLVGVHRSIPQHAIRLALDPSLAEYAGAAPVFFDKAFAAIAPFGGPTVDRLA